MKSYDLILFLLGLAFLAAAILPRLLRGWPLSLPMLYVGAGLILPFAWPGLPRIDPLDRSGLIERLTEMAVIISLMSAGLKIDRPLGWRSWATTRRLLTITMPLCILALTVGGIWLLGLPLAAAILLGAVIAPTDPVLAASVQVGPPGEECEHEVRFALTSEAGLNDGLAFPFVNLAIVIAATGLARKGLESWLAVDVAWRIGAGTAIGVFIGWAVAWLVFRLCRPEVMISDGFVALAEWNGGFETFDSLDRDGDAVITRTEFFTRGGSRYKSREERFRELDGDKDGRVSASEWKWGEQAMSVLDQNGDGFLSPREFRCSVKSGRASRQAGGR